MANIGNTDWRQVFLTVNSIIVESYLNRNLDCTEVPLANGQSVQILATYQDLLRARRHQYAAFVVEGSCLVVWDDEPLRICDRASDIIRKMTETVWTDSKTNAEPTVEKDGTAIHTIEVDPESGEVPTQKRRTMLLNTTYVGLTLLLIVAVIGAGAREVAIEVAVDGRYIRLAFLALTPIQVFFTLVRISLIGKFLQLLTVLSSLLRSLLVASHRWSDPLSRCAPTLDSTLTTLRPG